MMLFASGQSTPGSARRSALRSIQSIVPWRLSPRNVARRSAAPGGAAACAKRTVSKPSAIARARIASEIEFGIVGDRRLAGQAVGEQRAEGRPRLDAQVPFAGGRILRPRNFAEIVERRQMRRDGEIGEQARSEEHT